MKLPKLKNIKKEQIVVIFIIGLLLMVITLPTKEKKTSEDNNKAFDLEQSIPEDEEETYVSEMEHQLESCLEKMEGVGKVQVMITLESSTEQVLAKDRTSSRSSENMEKDEEQGSDSEENSDSESSETTVFSEVDSNLTPYVIKEISPSVKGVFVVAEGGDDPIVKQNVSNAVMALFSIESHKIMVVKMKQG